MAIDPNLFAARRLGFGLKIGDDLPAPPREWAMEQVRSVPKLDFYDQDGSSLAAKVPPDAALTDYATACIRFGQQQYAEDAIHDKRSPDEERLMAEMFAMYSDIPHWGAIAASVLTAVNGPSPVFERFWQFWCNHFAVSPANNPHLQILFSAHLQTIRAAMTGSFENLLLQAVGNPAMIYYLDNVYSVGPHSKNGGWSSLNENLGRELLELHTVSPAAGYTQEDVVQAALILTGWTFSAGVKYRKAADYFPGAKPGLTFNAGNHEPGPRKVMGKTYAANGKDGGQLRALVADLAVHPSTAKFIATKLVRAFVADDPPADSVERIATVFSATKGDLVAVHSAVIDEALNVGPRYPKFTKPSTWMQQAHRTLGIMPPLRAPTSERSKAGIRAILIDLGEEFCSPPQPNGWPETEADWLSLAMLDRRVRYANVMGSASPDFKLDQIGAYTDRLAGADSVTAKSVKRAESLKRAMIILLVSPQFLRI